MDLTYHQILAEVYEDNAKNVLIHHTEYEDEDQPPYEKYDYEENELENKEDFQKFNGDRNKPSHVIKPDASDKGKTDLNHKTNIRTIVLNIDGNFRGNIVPTNSQNCNIPSESNIGLFNQSQTVLLSNLTNILQSSTTTTINIISYNGNNTQSTSSSWFTFLGSKLYKNITSVKLTSLEFYNSFYTFSYARGNTYFYIQFPNTSDSTKYLIIIPDGNYKDYPTFASAIQSALKYPFDNTYLSNKTSQRQTIPYQTTQNFTVVYDSISHTIIIKNINQFTITFPSNQTNPYGNGIGYNMGFVSNTYNSDLSLQFVCSDQSPDIVQDTYVYLQINDWNLVEHQQYGQTHFPVFAKIPLTSPKNTILFDNNYLNSTTKEYVFPQPSNLQKFEIKMLDVYGNTLDLRGGSFSMTIELQQVNHSAVYEKLLEL
jgi:hypothetical protein